MLVYDYYCPECDKTVELYVTNDDQDIKFCDSCTSFLYKMFPAPKGFVIGTENPVKYK